MSRTNPIMRKQAGAREKGIPPPYRAVSKSEATSVVMSVLANKQSEWSDWSKKQRIERIDPEIRKMNVYKLIEARFPPDDLQRMSDVRMEILFPFAKKIEYDMYQKADSTREYFWLIDKKIDYLNGVRKSVMAQRQKEESEESEQYKYFEDKLKRIYSQTTSTKDSQRMVYKKEITLHCRIKMIKKLENIILPSSAERVLLIHDHNEIMAFHTFIKEMESNIYKTTNSASEYYKLMLLKLVDLNSEMNKNIDGFFTQLYQRYSTVRRMRQMEKIKEQQDASHVSCPLNSDLSMTGITGNQTVPTTISIAATASTNSFDNTQTLIKCRRTGYYVNQSCELDVVPSIKQEESDLTDLKNSLANLQLLGNLQCDQDTAASMGGINLNC